ncbi:MAG TPA: hypothetical protein P5244_11030 [Syntrophales bacterium]|nr:hypothetical protein [Syntrophales bacterium]
MANLTNIHNVPEEIVRVLQPRARKHPNDIYLTELNNTDLVYYLKKKFADKLQEDVSEMLFALLGSAVHYILDKGAHADALTEERLVIPIMGYNLVMRPDNWRDKVLSDWKVTRVFAFMFGEKEDWAFQLNGYAWGLAQYGFETERLVINAILRDWDRRRAKYERDYPPIPFVSVEYPLWPFEKTEGIIRDKLMQFKRVDEGYVPDVCPDEFRWHRPDVWAVKKKGTKRALPGGAKFRTQAEAEAFAAAREGPKMKCEIEFRKGEYSRCRDYCIARSVCQYNPYRESEVEDGDNNQG